MFPTQVLPASNETIRQAAQALLSGDLVAIPTETVYGLAANASDEAAVAQIFAAKERPKFDPLIVHVQDATQAKTLIDSQRLTPAAQKTFDRATTAFWPGPLTIIMPKSPIVSDLITAGLSTVALRAPRHPVAQQLLSQLDGCGLAAPSANRFGKISPTSAQDVLDELAGRIPYILDGGRCDIGLESTVLRILVDGRAQILRPGAIDAKDLHSQGISAVASTASAQLHSPGMLSQHYSPGKPFRKLKGRLGELGPAEIQAMIPQGTRCVGLLLRSQEARLEPAQIEKWVGHPVEISILSQDGNLEESAKNLFSRLRRLEQGQSDFLLYEPFEEKTGLSFAISDRLQRASAH